MVNLTLSRVGFATFIWRAACMLVSAYIMRKRIVISAFLNHVRCFITVYVRWRSSINKRGKKRHLVFSGCTAFSVSVTSAVSSFTRLWSYRGMRQIVAMERKELK